MIKKMIIVLLFVGTSLFVQAQQLKVTVLQGQESVNAKGDRYQLQKAPFTLLIESKGIEGFLIGATLDDDVYRSAIGEADLEVAWYQNTGMAESLFNPDQAMSINNDAPSYWYYTNKDDHRFDRNAIGTSSKWIAKRTITKLDVIENEKQITLEDIDRPLYLIFYTQIYDEDYNVVDRTILFRGEIQWNDPS